MDDFWPISKRNNAKLYFMNLVIDLQYFPSIILFESLYKFSNIVFEQYENYQKMSFRNRCQLAGGEGLIELSVPLVKGRSQKTLMKDVRIANDRPWQAQHWKTVVSCYSRSPWFEYYYSELEAVYKKQYDLLADWNRDCFEWALRMLKLSIPVSETEIFREQYEEADWVDWRGKLLPKNRGLEGGLAGSGRHGAGPLKYRQVFEERVGFIPNLSILDLLFCEGREAGRLLAARGGTRG